MLSSILYLIQQFDNIKNRNFVRYLLGNKVTSCLFIITYNSIYQDIKKCKC